MDNSLDAFRQSVKVSLRIGVLVATLGFFPVVLYAQQSKPNEYQVKSVYLLNFSRFIEWPSQSGAAKDNPFTICVLGEDPFGRSLDTTIAGENVDGKSVATRRISKPQDALTCQVLFVSSSEQSHLKDILAALDKKSVLTVSDMPHFSERGGMIGFVMEKDKIRFEVNLTNATDAGLTLSSDLLKVAVMVRKNGNPGD